MFKRTTNAGVFAGCLIVGILGGSATAYALGPQFENPEPEADYSGAHYDVPGLYVDSVAELPRELQASDIAQTLQADTVRLLRADSDVSTYVSLDNRGALCLTVFRAGHEWAAGTACTGPDEFAARGLGVRLTTPEGISEQYLLPHDVVEAGGSLAENGLLIVDPHLSSDARADLSKRANIELMGAPRDE
jgi:hypothetical protein